MEIKDFCTNFINVREEIDNIITRLTQEWFNEKIFIEVFQEVKPWHLSNDILMGVIINGFCLVDKEEFYEHYSLSDIDMIYQKLLQYENKVSLELVSDYADFLYSTLDKNEESTLIAEGGLERAEDISKKFKELLSDINKENTPPGLSLQKGE